MKIHHAPHIDHHPPTGRVISLPRCPACKASELRHELADRHRCDNCGYRVLIDDTGRVRNFMPWTTAGRKTSRHR